MWTLLISKLINVIRYSEFRCRLKNLTRRHWSNSSIIQNIFKLHKVIDTAGWYFDVEFHDINKNRNLELFTSTWSRSGEFGQTIAYERIGADWRKPESWSKREIYKRFPTFANAGFGSPGGFDFAVSDH